MKKTLFFAEIALLCVVFGGFVLGLVGSVMLALDNAMYDYYNDTSRQLWGWLLCFVPAIIALMSGAMYCLRRKFAFLELKGSMVLFLSSFIPLIYMAVFGAFLQFVFVAVVLFFVAAQGLLVITYLNNRQQR